MGSSLPLGFRQLEYPEPVKELLAEEEPLGLLAAGHVDRWASDGRELQEVSVERHLPSSERDVPCGALAVLAQAVDGPDEQHVKQLRDIVDREGRGVLV